MSKKDETRKANYDRVRRFLTEAEAAANKSHSDAKNFGRSHGQSERMPFIVLVDYTARGSVPRHSTVKHAFYRRDKGGIEDNCTGRYHCYKKKFASAMGAHTFLAAELVKQVLVKDDAGDLDGAKEIISQS